MYLKAFLRSLAPDQFCPEPLCQAPARRRWPFVPLLASLPLLFPAPPLLAQGGSPAIAAPDASGAAGVLEEVLVTAEFRPLTLEDTAASISVFSQQAIEDRKAVYLDQLLNLAPNVNFASGASRGRFFQVRGIGERSQFVEPINPSVGLLVDGMDFTGIGAVAGTFDLRQVEVLRGPQGTLFGANALAGLINMVSNAPTDEFGGRAEVILGNEAQRNVSVALGGPASNTLRWRLAAQANQSDGFTRNVFLGRPTQDIDERHARGRMNWTPRDDLEFDLTVLLSDVDNGYDAFSLDNTRETYSDEPGRDTLESVAGALRSRWALAAGGVLELLLSHVDADTDYSFDEDWSNRGICDGTPCDSSLWGFDWWYSSVDAYARGNRNTVADLRWLSAEDADGLSWVAGLYSRQQDQSLERVYTFASGDFLSEYDTRNLAAYGQLDIPLAGAWTVSAGLRLERRDWDYEDNVSGTAGTPGTSEDEDFWGGRLALEYRSDSGVLWYGLVSRGYKPGGYNSALASQLPDLEAAGVELPPDALLFGGERLLNYELGVKGRYLDGRLRLGLALFYQDRDEVQVKQSIVIPVAAGSDACPCLFVDSLQNASGGANQGLELELDWLATDQLRLFGSLGLLDTRYRDYQSFTHSEADPENGVPFDLSGREQAHAPAYQYTVGAELRLGEPWAVQMDIEGKDGFYTSANHNERTDSYILLNLRLAWATGPFELALWGRNLTDQDVQTRGFGGFGNDPRKFYEVEPYYQLGEPRVYGVSAAWVF